MTTHLLSPLLYVGFYRAMRRIPPCPHSETMKRLRMWHNVGLSTYSLITLGCVVVGLWSTPKTNTLHSSVCDPFPDSRWLDVAFVSFLYSKYWEWIDTLFLHLAGRPVSWLQLTHHASTALLVHINIHDNGVTQYSSHIVVPVVTNCMAHVPMYWYFAFPKGILRTHAKHITTFQIVQHVLCIVTILYTATQDCRVNTHSHHVSLSLYVMYLFFFAHFYRARYSAKEP